MILLGIKHKSDTERSEENVGSALGSGWAYVGMAMALPLPQGEACSQRF